MTGFVKLYRAVSAEEWADLQQCGAFRPAPPSNQGKWFAETAVDAAEWGKRLPSQGGDTFLIVEVEIPIQVGDQLFRLPNLDRIGPARFANVDHLALLNSSKRSLREIPLSSLGVP